MPMVLLLRMEHLSRSMTNQEQEVRSVILSTFCIYLTDLVIIAVAAEYLAKGYNLSDQILQKAIDIDCMQTASSNLLCC
jgi:hypothetical protein